jgi:threonyl-tRNA synthetase
MDLIDSIYKKFGFDYRVELSTRPEKRIGSDKIWDKSEKALKKVLDKRKVKYKMNKGDGAFYGPKIDFHLKDSLGRTWQCGTIQLDFSMPERFELEYTDKDNKRKRPVMLHRTIFGSLERFIGILIEHTNGRLPTWLAPIQVRVLSFTDRNEKYARGVIQKIGESIPNVRIDTDFTQTGIPSKVKDAEVMKVPYIVTVGDREEKDNSLAVRVRGNKELETLGIDEFIFRLKSEIGERV